VFNDEHSLSAIITTASTSRNFILGGTDYGHGKGGGVQEGDVSPAARRVKPNIKYTTKYMHLGSQLPVLI
jgi:hypothetical protein